MKPVSPFLLLPILVAFTICPANGDTDPALAAAEKARGIMTGNNGVRWLVSVVSKSADGTRTAKFNATSQGAKIFAKILEPEEAKGRCYIAEADGKMWFWKPGLSRPVSVSKRQRLSGDASIGDVASTSYVEGYKVDSSEDGDVNGEAATVYTMKSNSLSDTYNRIKYWVTKDGNLGKKAEFYASSGTLIRTATMEYGNQANGGPFLSKMVVKDSGREVTLSFSEVELGQFPDELFDREKMGGTSRKIGPKRPGRP